MKKVICFALGGHIATQNASFKRLAELLEPRGYRFYGAADGFKAFETGQVHELRAGSIPERFAGFVAGAGRATLKDKEGGVDPNKLDRAREFFKKGGFTVAIGSGGDDHSEQMRLLGEALKGEIQVYALNKTMDNDLGGQDGLAGAPHTDFTNGFHTAVSVGVQMVRHHFAGAWTNNVPYLVGHFGRETNWVGIALAYWGHADRILYGELPDTHPGHSIDRIAELIRESQQKNREKYGRKFAMIIVPEGTRVAGIDHVAKGLVDAHGHHKLQPELLVSHLREALKTGQKIDTQIAGITYEMRNFPPTARDVAYARLSAKAIAGAIVAGNSGAESTFKIVEGKVTAGVAPIQQVAVKRYAAYYSAWKKPLLNEETFEVTDEIGRYYQPLFGDRGRLTEFLPKKPKLVQL